MGLMREGVGIAVSTAFTHLEKVTEEYNRGLITGVEYLAEVTEATKEIEDLRNSERINSHG